MKPDSPDVILTFPQLLEHSIKDGLRHVLGQSGLEMISSLCPIEVMTTDTGKLHALLKSIFMDEGAGIIEREIARELLSKVGDDPSFGRDKARLWLSLWIDSGRKKGGVSENEQGVLRQFGVIAALPAGYSGLQQAVQVTAGGGNARDYIESTAFRFADAFKKGN